MNNFQQKLPKEKRGFKYKGEVQEMVIKINRLIQQEKYSAAYDLIEKCKTHLNSRSYYTDEQRALIRDAAIRAVEKELKQEIKKEYLETLKFYNNSYNFTELQKSPYPENATLFVRSKAKEMLMEKYKNRRFGGYMHVVINKIVNECNDELDSANKKSIKLKQVKAIKNDDWER